MPPKKWYVRKKHYGGPLERTVNVRMTAKMYDWLRDVAALHNLTISKMVRVILDNLMISKTVE